jgi:hypothetical protein
MCWHAYFPLTGICFRGAALPALPSGPSLHLVTGPPWMMIVQHVRRVRREWEVRVEDGVDIGASIYVDLVATVRAKDAFVNLLVNNASVGGLSPNLCTGMRCI